MPLAKREPKKARDKGRRRRRRRNSSARRAHMREKIGLIPNFERAIRLFEGPTREGFCQHLRSKAWGDKYGKGVRCLDCGKEMTRTHEEPEQLQGLGGGDDPALCRRVARHRRNPAAYRAETLDMRKELAEIEEERRRLEKEDYLVRQSDIHFYDFDEMKAVYVSAF